MKYFKKIIQMIILCLISSALAKQETMSLDMQNVALRDAIYMVAKTINSDVVISSHVVGMTSLHVHAKPANEILNSLLLANGLSRWMEGGVCYILTNAEYVHKKQQLFSLNKILDNTDDLVAKIWQIRYAKAAEVLQILQGGSNSFLSKRGIVRVDARTNRLYLLDTSQHLTRVDQLIQKLDLPLKQVRIEARLASIDTDFEQELGINWSLQAVGHAAMQAGNYSLIVARLADGSLLDMRLAALEKNNHAQLIARPSLVTSNQQPASIESGEEIPYQEVSLSGGTAVAFKKAVLRLRVTPQLLPHNKMLLQLEVNQDSPTNRLIQGVPAITTRQMSTNIQVDNGQTIALGGIYELDSEAMEQQTPFFSKIPLVGWLFQQHNVVKHKRELFIFVTPTMIDMEK